MSPQARACLLVLAVGALAGACERPEAQLERLKAPEAATRVAAARELARLRFAPARSALEVALADPEVEVRRESATALAALASRESVGPLLGALGSDQDPEVKAALGAALQALGPAAADGALAALGDPQSPLRTGAVRFIAQAKDGRGVEPLLALALGDGAPHRSSILAAAREALAALANPRVRAGALQALADGGNPARQANAAALLGFVGDVAAVPALAAVLTRRPDAEERAAWEGEAIEEDDYDEYEEEDDDEGDGQGEVSLPVPTSPELEGTPRLAAAEALARLGEPGLQALLAAAKSTALPICTPAVRALGATRDPRALEALIALLDLDPMDDVTGTLDFELRGALASWGEEGESRLLAAARSDDDYTRERALGALTSGKTEVSEAVFAAVLAALEDDYSEVRAVAGRFLADSTDLRAEQHLLAEYAAKDLDTLVAAYPFFIAKGIPGSEKRLLAALAHSADEYAIYRLDMASAMLNCGNAELERGVREWCDEQSGCQIQAGGPGLWVADSRWGSAAGGNP